MYFVFINGNIASQEKSSMEQLYIGAQSYSARLVLEKLYFVAAAGVNFGVKTCEAHYWRKNEVKTMKNRTTIAAQQRKTSQVFTPHRMSQWNLGS